MWNLGQVNLFYCVTWCARSVRILRSIRDWVNFSGLEATGENCNCALKYFHVAKNLEFFIFFHPVVASLEVIECSWSLLLWDSLGIRILLATINSFSWAFLVLSFKFYYEVCFWKTCSNLFSALICGHLLPNVADVTFEMLLETFSYIKRKNKYL